MTGVIEVLWLGMLLGVGAALSVGPIFVVIVQQAATSGFGASVRVILLYLAWQAARDALALWREGRQLLADGRWAFWKGVAGNLANPLTWTFWLATGTPAMLAAQQAGGPAGVALFTATWFLVASGLEAVIALAVARSGRLVGARGQAWFTAVSAVAFLGLALTLVARDVLPRLG